MAKKQAASKSSSSSKPRNWTFMVYMVAGQSRELDAVAVRDLREMELGCRDNDDVHVVVQIKRNWPRSAQLYEVRADGSHLIDQLPVEAKMGEGETLAEFVSTVARAPEYRAENYCLILWGHAFGLGFGRDHDDPLLLSELRKALDAFKKARAYKPSEGDGRLEILGTNSCSMSYIEGAFELRNSAQYMIASQITVPFAGWPYDVILQRVDDSIDADKLSKLIIDAYVTQFDDLPGGERLAMTQLNLAAGEGLDKALESLGKAIDSAILSSQFSSDTLAQLRDLFTGSAAGDVRPLIELTTLLRSLLEADEAPFSGKIADAAQSLLDLLHLDTEDRQRLVRRHQAHPDLDDLHGIGIYAPFVTDKGIIERLGMSDAPAKPGGPKRLNGRQHYEQLEIFAKGAKAAWPRLVYDRLRRTIPADLIVAIDGIGEFQAGDRADVAQIVMSIESSLNQFDRVVKKAKHGVEQTLAYPPSAVKSGNSDTIDEPTPAFSAPWLRLITPLSVDALETVKKMQELMSDEKDQTPVKSVVSLSNPSPTVSVVVAHLGRVEKALSRVERVTRRGLTHARFGLGLLDARPSGFGIDPPKSGEGIDPPKSGEGIDPPKSGEGIDPPKSGDGVDPPKSGDGLPGGAPDGGDLRVDRGVRRVADLFAEVGRVMGDLERSIANLEHVARSVLVLAPAPATDPAVIRAAAAQQLEAAFLTVKEASARARRVIRRALAHPIYGLGPGEGQLTYDVRQELASRGGLDSRRLKLL